MQIEFQRLEINNIGPFEKVVYCFNKNDDPQLIFGINKESGMSRNGVGKSMIPDILTWVLWDETVRGINKDDMVRSGQKEGRASVYFKVSDVNYRITRNRKLIGSKNNKVYFERLSKEGKIDRSFKGTGKTNNITQNKIDKLIFPYQTFVSICYFGQNSVNKFLSGASSEREEIITKFFDLHIWDKVKDQTKSRIKYYREILERNQTSLDSWKNVIYDVDYDKVQAEKTELHKRKKKLEEKVNEVKDQRELINKINEYNSVLKEIESELKYAREHTQAVIDNLKSDINRAQSLIVDEVGLKKKLKKLEDSKIDVEDVRIQIDELEEKKKKLLKDRDKYLASKATCKNNAHELKEIIKSVKEPNCPTCGQKIDESIRELFREKYNKNMGHMRDWINRVEKIESAISKIDNKLDDLEQELFTNKNIDVEIAKINNILKEQANYKKEIVNKKKQIKNIKDEYVEKNSALKKSMESHQKKIEQLHGKIDYENFNEINELIDSAYEEIGKIDKRTGELKQVLTQYRSAKRNIDEIESEIKDKKDALYYVEYFYNLLPNIKYNIIDEINLELEDEINEILFQMGINNYQIILDTEWEKKTDKGKVNKYEIRIEHDGHVRRWESYSGGEKQRLQLAIYFAFQKIAERRTQRVNLLIFDEVFTALDTIGRQACLDLINSIKDKNIHVITHIDSVASKFKNRIFIVKENGVSEIRN